MSSVVRHGTRREIDLLNDLQISDYQYLGGRNNVLVHPVKVTSLASTNQIDLLKYLLPENLFLDGLLSL